MVPPALACVVPDVILPYGVALKLVSVIGILSLPVCCWLFGKLAGLRFPVPQLFSIAAVFFLFDETFQIYGGHIPPPLAGGVRFSLPPSPALASFSSSAHPLRARGDPPLAAPLPH